MPIKLKRRFHIKPLGGFIIDDENDPPLENSDSSAESRNEKATSDFAQSSNEKILFLMNRFTGVAPYSHEFVMGDLDPQMLSGFVGAMGSFLGEFVGSEHSQWKTIYGSDTEFIVEGGEWILGVLAVSRETRELRSKLRSIVFEFEDSFAALKESDGLEGGLFDEFDNFVRRTFTEDRLSEMTVLQKGVDWKEINAKFSSLKAKFETIKLLHDFPNGASVNEYIRMADMELADVLELLSIAFWKGLVFFQYVPSNDDILSLSDRAPGSLLSKANPLNLSLDALAVLGSLDGRTQLGEIMSSLAIDSLRSVPYEIGTLLNNGYIQRITIERKLTLANECVLSHLFNAFVEVVGSQDAKDSFNSVIRNGILGNPWLSRVRFMGADTIQIMIDDSATPKDMDEVYDALEFLIQGAIREMTHYLAREDADALLLYARKKCQEDWMPTLKDSVM